MKKVLLFFSALFLAFIPLGSAPIYAGPFKIDNLIGIFLALFLLLFLMIRPAVRKDDSFLLFFAVLYFFWLFVSVITSPEPVYSFKRYLIIGGYAFIAFLLPRVLTMEVPLLSRLVFIFGFVSACIIWISYAILGMPSWGRMTIPTWHNGSFKYFPEGWGSSADPNMLGFGLLLSLLFGMTFFTERKVLSFAVVFIVVSAAFLTFSRTALFSIIISLLLSLVVYLFTKRPFKFKRPKFDYFVYFFLGTSLIIIFYLYLPVIEFVNRAYQKGMAVRFNLYEEVIANWIEKENSVLTGVGFNMARVIKDPHNIYVTALHDSGIVGLVLLFIFMGLLFLACLRVKKEWLCFLCLLIFFYIAAGGMAYWHTKTFWASVMFIQFIYVYDRMKFRLENSHTPV